MKRRPFGAIEADAIRGVAGMDWRDFYEATVLYFGWPEQKAVDLWDWVRSRPDDGEVK